MFTKHWASASGRSIGAWLSSFWKEMVNITKSGVATT
jgi:hypothetical protein